MATTPSAAKAHDVPGWYGKLSSLGDFAQRRLPPHWLNTCDAWLSTSMRSGSEQLGERWLQVYLTAPLLRFAWAPGVIDAQWWFGLLMPSCDSVGRYFPLVLTQPRARPPEDRIALDHLELWYERLAQAATNTLNGSNGTIEALESALHDAPPWPTPGHHVVSSARPSIQREHFRLARHETLSTWLHTVAAGDLVKRLAGCTVWWRVGEPSEEDAIDIVSGLPDGPQFVALLAAQPDD